MSREVDWGGLGWVRVGSLPQKWRPFGLQCLSALHCLQCSLLCIAVCVFIAVFVALQFVFVALQFCCCIAVCFALQMALAKMA